MTKLLPGWMTNILLFVLLVYLSVQMWIKARGTFRQETASLHNSRASSVNGESSSSDIEGQSVCPSAACCVPCC